MPYRGVELCELPPSNHGIVALIMLKMLERLGKPPANPVSAERYHLLMEAARLAFAMRDAFVADPDMADVPVEHMLDDATIDKLVKRIDRKKHRPELGPLPQPAGSDTVCFSIVDEKGMVVSFINSLYGDFGTGIVTTKTGITLHNRGEGFVLDPAHRNCIAPRKRPMHTLVPAMVLRDGKPVHVVRRDGRALPADGPRLHDEQHVRLRHGRAAGDRHPARVLRGRRRGGRGVRAGRRRRGPEGPRPPHRGAATCPGAAARPSSSTATNGILIGASDGRKDGMALGY